MTRIRLGRPLIAALILGAVALVSPKESSAAPTVITVAGDQSYSGVNCYPFGCGTAYAPYFIGLYKNLSSFTLNVGDTIAFDTNGINDNPETFSIALANMSSNGGTVEAGPYTTIVTNQTPIGSPNGDNITGNYDLVYTVQNAFTFNGGGLAIRFQYLGPYDYTWIGNVVGANGSDTSNLFVERVYNSSGTVLTGYSDSGPIPNFRLTLGQDVPAPGALALLGLGLFGIAGLRRKVKTT